MWETHGPGSESPTCRQPHPQTAILLLYATQEKRTQNHKNTNMDALFMTLFMTAALFMTAGSGSHPNIY